MPTYYERKFKCTCNNIAVKKYKWSDDEKPEICTCGSDMEEIIEETVQSTFIGGKHKNGRSEAEKKQRRLKDFQENIYPTLAKKDKEFFKKKHGWKE